MFGANPSNAFITPSTVNVSAVWSVIWSLWNTPAETRIKSRKISAQMRNWVTSLTWRRSSTSAHSCLQLLLCSPTPFSHPAQFTDLASGKKFEFCFLDKWLSTYACLFLLTLQSILNTMVLDQLLLVLGEHNGQFFLLSWWSFCLSLLFSRSAS